MPGDPGVPLQSRSCRACCCQTIHWRAAKLELEQSLSASMAVTETNHRSAYPPHLSRLGRLRKLKSGLAEMDGTVSHRLTGKGSLLTDPCTRDHIPLEERLSVVLLLEQSPRYLGRAGICASTNSREGSQGRDRWQGQSCPRAELLPSFPLPQTPELSGQGSAHRALQPCRDLSVCSCSKDSAPQGGNTARAVPGG